MADLGFMQWMETIICHVAAGHIDKYLIQSIITCYMATVIHMRKCETV